MVLVSSFKQKAAEIEKRGISAYVDDQDEVLLHIPDNVTVLKIRNGGNFNFEERKWLFSRLTGRMI